MSGTQAVGNNSAAYYAQLQALGYLNDASASSDPTSTQSSVAVNAVGSTSQAGGGVAISSFGQLVSSLQQLQAQDPAKFSQVASQIAGQLQDAAQQQGQTPAGNFLSKVAGQFQTAAQTGDASQLHAGGARHHHHGGGHHGGGYDQSNSSTSSSSATADGLQDLFSTLTGEVTTALGE